ncbi:NAD(P)/FAD-dependent oxidoreductase [Elizabethkingia anophelis]|nr:NAD(P)/FAD-dependent oxidoreductase [Elizabethkingia anophelis]MCT4122349.1 NAD(P)/FAD-dependent oxidoreductase [Elizabethkingia anophelis]
MTNLNRRTFIKQSGILATAFALPLSFNPFKEDKKMKDKNQFDVIIIGGSYAGLATAMALGRALRNVLIIDSGKPCNRQTPHSHNFLTQDGKTPKEIATLAKQQVVAYDTVTFFDGIATKGLKTSNGFKIQTETGNKFSATKLVFATGIKDMMPNIIGFSECWGISVLHCPYCHGYEVKNEITGILGNGEYGFEFSKLISNWTKRLTLFTNGALKLTSEQITKLEKHSIEIVEKEIKGLEHVNGQLKNILFKDGSKQTVKAIYTQLPFEQNCTVAEQLGCELTEDGYIKIDASQKTTTKDVFACGDNATRLRTVANAVAMGTLTGMTVNKDLIEELF